MGSGHFLVEVVEHIARFLVDLGAAAFGGTVPGGTLPEESDLAYWKRRVASSCVYGVDLNPLAVDLAKLSLWLSTAAKDRPLSFLDHHLRVGNSLVGSRLSDLGTGGDTSQAAGASSAAERKRARRAAKAAEQAEAAGQISMLEDDAFRQSMSQAVDSMWLIEGIAGLTLADVKQQEQLYLCAARHADPALRGARDLATARRFGLQVDPELAPAPGRVRRRQQRRAVPAVRRVLRQVSELAERHRFFHWELEFPEVFFDKHGYGLGEQAGFDVVVGNPPYVRQETLAPYKEYFAEVYPEVYQGTADLFVYFFAQGMKQLRREGRLSYIASNSWLRANYATPLRKFLREKTTVERIVDLGDNRVFSDAPDVYPAILVALNRQPIGDATSMAATFGRGQGIENFASRIATIQMAVAIHDQPDSGWQLTEDAERRLFEKLTRGAGMLGEVPNVRIYRGVLTGLNEAFVVDQATRNALIRQHSSSRSVLRPFVNGEDVRPWHVEDEGRWLILLPDGWTAQNFGGGLGEGTAWTRVEEAYPAIASHLAPFAEAGRKRADRGEYWWELRACSYYHEFDASKLFWPEMSKQPRFSMVAPGIIGNKTTFMIPGQQPYLLGLLMSRAMWFAASRLCVPIGERAGLLRYTLSAQFMSRLPIPQAPAGIQDAVATIAIQLTDFSSNRYRLHSQARHRILSDLGQPGARLNLKLIAWWDLDFPAFRAELKKALGTEIPLKQRDEWEAWLYAKRAEHERLTSEIVRLETELNAKVYELFDLTPAEIKIIEESTKYKYGEV